MRQWLGITARGAAMGAADIIPGVSGGTMALILGIYTRFITAVSSLGPGMLRAVLRRSFWKRSVALASGRSPTDDADARTAFYAEQAVFLVFLAVGIGAAIAVGAKFIPRLLDLYPAPMLGLFMGLVLASVPLPAREVKRWGGAPVAALVVCAIATFLIVGLPADHSTKASGEVQLSLTAPVTERTVIPARDLVFVTERHGDGGAKREVAFGPVVDVTLEAGQQTARISVRSRLAGTAANLAAGSLTGVEGPEVTLGARAVQSVPMTGGLDPPTWFIFVAGMIAISAMVLPGISGSFILLLFGMYHFITFNLREAIYAGDGAAAAVVGVFMAAMLVGITLFSRLLKWLLEHHRGTTMAGLVGVMLGSLRKLWPFTEVDATGATVSVMPDASTTTAITLAAFVVGGAAVVVLERMGRRAAPEPTL